MHLMWRQRKLREVCSSKNVHVTAYSPLGSPWNPYGLKNLLQHPIVHSIASKHEATPAQVQTDSKMVIIFFIIFKITLKYFKLFKIKRKKNILYGQSMIDIHEYLLLTDNNISKIFVRLTQLPCEKYV